MPHFSLLIAKNAEHFSSTPFVPAIVRMESCSPSNECPTSYSAFDERKLGCHPMATLVVYSVTRHFASSFASEEVTNRAPLLRPGPESGLGHRSNSARVAPPAAWTDMPCSTVVIYRARSAGLASAGKSPSAFARLRRSAYAASPAALRKASSRRTGSASPPQASAPCTLRQPGGFRGSVNKTAAPRSRLSDYSPGGRLFQCFSHKRRAPRRSDPALCGTMLPCPQTPHRGWGG